ncbi:unnamed protein product, partial [Sphagnum balticum]
ERNLSWTQSKDTSSVRDLCNNGVGVGSRDYRAIVSSSMESRVQEEKNGKRRGQEIAQLFGGRRGGGANDAQRVVELASGFPEEDVLEVARQAVNEVEQMQENNNKPVSSSSSERDGKNARATGGITNGGEMKDVTTTSDMAGREQQQVSPTVVDDRVKTGTPIAVLAATKGAFIPPASPIRIKGELGWKGSAATSAFRPAEPRRTPDRQHSNAESLASDANLSLNTNAVKRAQSSSSAHPISNGNGSGSLQASHGQALPSCSGYGAMRPNLDLDLNRMDNSEECGMPPPFSSDAQAAEAALGPLAPIDNSISKPPPRRVMDFDLNDGPSFEEVAVDEPLLQSLPVRRPAGNAPMPVPMSGLRIVGEAMNLSPWFSAPGNSFQGVALPTFPPARVPDPVYSVAATTAAQSFLNVGFRPSSVPLPATTSAPFVDAASGPVPFPAMSSNLGSQPTVPSTYIRPPFLMGMPAEVAAAADNGSGGAWSIRSLDLNAGPELADADSTRDDMMHGRLLPLHPAAPAVFNEQMRANLSQVSGNSGLMMTPLKRKEPEGQWSCYTGN